MPCDKLTSSNRSCSWNDIVGIRVQYTPLGTWKLICVPFVTLPVLGLARTQSQLNSLRWIASKMIALKTFHPFPRLPTELRLKIWHAALPSRVVEPDVDCDSSLIFGKHNTRSQKVRRRIPSIFAVNGESRSYCLEQYVPFAGTYIHPTLDTLLFSSDDEKSFWLELPSFYHITDHPLARLKAIAIEVEYDRAETDFRGLLHWIRGLGCPQELILCLFSRGSSSGLFMHYLRTYGTTRITGPGGDMSRLVKWPSNFGGPLVQQVRLKLIRTLQEERNIQADFEIPAVCEQLYFAYSE